MLIALLNEELYSRETKLFDHILLLTKFWIKSAIVQLSLLTTAVILNIYYSNNKILLCNDYFSC